MKNNMSRNYKIDFVNNTITISKTFAQKATILGSSENTEMNTLRATYPTMKFIHKATKSPSKARGAQPKLTYAAMTKYMGCLPHGEIYLKEFRTVKEMSVIQKSPYFYVQKWFVATFPDFQALPAFDENGQLVASVNLLAGKKVLAEMETTEELQEVA